MTLPRMDSVWALYALQNSMMFTPCGPRAVPTGGAGVAAPAWSCTLTSAAIFFLGGMCLVLFLSRGHDEEYVVLALPPSACCPWATCLLCCGFSERANHGRAAASRLTGFRDTSRRPLASLGSASTPSTFEPDRAQSKLWARAQTF